MLGVVIIYVVSAILLVPSTHAFAEKNIVEDSRALENAPWPMFMGNPQHTGLSKYTTANNSGREKWCFDTGLKMESSPAIGKDGTIYVGSTDYSVYALYPNGTKKWSFGTYYEIYSSPAIGSNGVIYIGSDDDNLYAINPDGTLRWRFPTNDVVDSSPTIGEDGTIYVGSGDDNLYAINPDGTLKWNITLNGPVFSSPAIGGNNIIYVGTASYSWPWYGTLYAISPNGAVKWSVDFNNSLYSSPAIGKDGTIYVGSDDNNIYAISPDGAIKWSFPTGDFVDSSPAIGSDGTIYIGSDDGTLYALNPDGSLKWKFSARGTIDSSPTIGADGTIYVGSNDGALYAINPDGTLKWKFSTGAAIKSSAAIGEDGTVYVSSDDGCIYAIGNIPPAPPRNLRARIGDGYVNLSWASPEDDGGSKVLHYKVYRNSVLIGEVSASQRWFNDTKVKVSSRYSYEVSAVNAVGEGNLSNFANVSWSTPTVPQNFKVVRGDGYVLLSWSAPASDGNTHIINYVIYRNGELLAKINSSSLSYNDSNINVKNKYLYSVAAVNGVGVGAKSEAKEVAWGTPWQVRDLKYKIEGGMFDTPKLVLSWSAPKDNGGTKIKYYEVYLYIHGKWKLAGWSNSTSTSIDMGNYLSSTLFGGSQVIKVAVFAVNAVGYGQGAYIPATVPLPINWYVWAGIISGIIVAAVIVTMLYMKMRKKKK